MRQNQETKWWFWKYIKNKGKVTLERSNFPLRKQLFVFKKFRMETRFCNISKTTKATDLIRTIMKSSCRVLLDACNLTTSTQLVFLLRTVEFYRTFDIWYFITFAIFWEKLRNYILLLLLLLLLFSFFLLQKFFLYFFILVM